MARQKAGGAITGGIQIKGAEKLLKQLKELEVKEAKKIVRRATREAAKPIADLAREKAPKQTGELAGSIKVRAASKLKRGLVGATVITGEGFFKGDQFYAAFIELGHHQGKRELGDTRQWVNPKPFLRPAFDQLKERAVDIIADEIRKGIEAAVK